MCSFRMNEIFINNGYGYIIICPQQFEIMPGYEIIIKIGHQMPLTKEKQVFSKCCVVSEII